ncbi:LysR family transcriptional regulator [Serratia sp. 22264]|uniref:LysR family transcriptional regulator n=1 Tax=Serratia sp. 22264 TaxID=3453897 RepID=UPI003F8798DC
MWGTGIGILHKGYCVVGKLNLDQLQTFALVVRQGSFSAAGEVLGLTQPAVSLQIRQLEQRLHVRLLERVARRVRPTSAGEALLEHISHINAAVDHALSDMAGHAQEIAGTVTLGTGATACIHLLPTLLRELKQAYPLLNVGVRTGNTDDMVKAVEENRIDIALVTFPANGRSLQLTPLLQDEFAVIFPADSPDLPATFTPQTLGALPWVAFESGSSTRRLIDDWFLGAEVKPAPVMELGSIEAIKEMVAAGLGYSIVPRMALSGTRGDALTPALERTLGIVLRQDKPLSRALQKVLASLHALKK